MFTYSRKPKELIARLCYPDNRQSFSPNNSVGEDAGSSSQEWNWKLHLLASLPQFGTEVQKRNNFRTYGQKIIYMLSGHTNFFYQTYTSTGSDQFYQVSNANRLCPVINSVQLRKDFWCNSSDSFEPKTDQNQKNVSILYEFDISNLLKYLCASRNSVLEALAMIK